MSRKVLRGQDWVEMWRERSPLCKRWEWIREREDDALRRIEVHSIAFEKIRLRHRRETPAYVRGEWCVLDWTASWIISRMSSSGHR